MQTPDIGRSADREVAREPHIHIEREREKERERKREKEREKETDEIKS